MTEKDEAAPPAYCHVLAWGSDELPDIDRDMTWEEYDLLKPTNKYPFTDVRLLRPVFLDTMRVQFKVACDRMTRLALKAEANDRQ